MSNNLRRIVSCIIAMTMLFTSVFTNSVFADDITDVSESIQEETNVDSDSDSPEVSDINDDTSDNDNSISDENADLPESDDSAADENAEAADNTSAADENAEEDNSDVTAGENVSEAEPEIQEISEISLTPTGVSDTAESDSDINLDAAVILDVPYATKIENADVSTQLEKYIEKYKTVEIPIDETITYQLAKNNDNTITENPAINSFQGCGLTYAKTNVTIDGQEQPLEVFIDARKGKFHSDRTGGNSQVNSGTDIYLPVNGIADIKIVASNSKNDFSFILSDNYGYSETYEYKVNTDKNRVLKYKGNSKDVLKITQVEGNTYYESIEVTSKGEAQWEQKDFSIKIKDTNISVTGAESANGNATITVTGGNSKLVEGSGGVRSASLLIDNMGKDGVTENIVSDISGNSTKIESINVANGKVTVNLKGETQPSDFVFNVDNVFDATKNFSAVINGITVTVPAAEKGVAPEVTLSNIPEGKTAEVISKNTDRASISIPLENKTLTEAVTSSSNDVTYTVNENSGDIVFTYTDGNNKPFGYTINVEANDKVVTEESWIANDTELNKVISAAKENVKSAPYKGLSAYGVWGNISDISSAPVTYTHEGNSTATYTFTKRWEAGQGGLTRRSLVFKPKGSCFVTLAYLCTQQPTEADPRLGKWFINQGGKDIAQTDEVGTGTSDTKVYTIKVNIEDPSQDVVIYGGSNGSKYIYGVFVDYYDKDADTTYDLSGNMTYEGSLTDTDLANVKVVFTDKKAENPAEPVKVDLKAGTNAYTAALHQYRDFDISVEENDVKSTRLAVSLSTNYVEIKGMNKTDFPIKIVDIAKTDVTGQVAVHQVSTQSTPLDFENTVIRFTSGSAESNDLENIDAAFTAAPSTQGTIEYVGTIKATLMPNTQYTVSLVDKEGNPITGYELSKLSKQYVMEAGEENPFKHILINETMPEVTFDAATMKTLEVAQDGSKQFKRIGDAVKYVKAMKNRPSGEAGRITIEVAPGTYREQVIIDIPYITLKGADVSVEDTDVNRATANDKRPKVTFYYGVGYLYYSSNGGFYDEDFAVQKTQKTNPARWGCTVRVSGSNFIAENIIFEGSLNCYVTDEEIADGVEPAIAKSPQYSDGQETKPDRTVENYDPRTKKATERAAAIVIEKGGVNHELFNCDFISSQDTVYTSENGYFKNCYLEGMTDYIFNGNSIVFENCKLAWHGYSTTDDGGAITACSTSGYFDKDNINTYGYLFKNCEVIKSVYYPNQNPGSYSGNWGRNWGGKDCTVIYDGVSIKDVPVPTVWSRMGSNIDDSVLYVIGEVTKDGTAVDMTTKGTMDYYKDNNENNTKEHKTYNVFNPNGTMEENNFTPLGITDYFGSWVPIHYTGDIPEVDKYILEWFFGEINGAESWNEYHGEGSIIGKANTEIIEDKTLNFDASNGKMGNAGRNDEWCNVGTNTTFTFPASIGTQVTFGAYDDTIKLKIGTTEFNREGIYYVKESDIIDGKVTATATNGGYMSFIKALTPLNPIIPDEYTVTFSKGDDADIAGIVPIETITQSIGNSVNIPVNRSLYKEGYTLTAWTDGTNTYNVGADVSDISTNVTLTPVFTENTVSIAGGGYEITFDFQRVNGAPSVSWQNRSDDIWVAQAEIDGKTVDVKMDINTNPGKFNNTSWTDWAQVNEGTKFTMPVVKGSVITFVGYDDNYKIKVDGTETVFNQKESYTVDENKDTINLVVQNNPNSYLRSIRVVTPEAPKLSVVNFDKGSEAGVQGEAPDSVSGDIGTVVSIPTNRTLYVPGKTLVGWKANDTVYKAGDTFTTTDYSTVNLIPVFENNQVVTGGAVTFDFKDAPMVNWENQSGKLLVYQRVVKEKSINDVKIGIDTSNGKFVVEDGNGAKVSDGTKFTFDVAKGDIITFAAVGSEVKFTVGDKEISNNYEVVEDIKSITLTASGIDTLEFIKIEKADTPLPTEYEVNFAIGSDANVQGEAPASVSKPFGESVSIPTNRTLYSEGKTLVGWSDGTNTLKPGDTVNSEDYKVINLIPVFENNQIVTGGAVTFDFNDTPAVNWENESDKLLVYQKTVDGKTIDVKVAIDTTNAKFESGSNGAIVSDGTKFTIDVVKGDVITFSATGSEPKLMVGDTSIDIAGEGYKIPDGLNSITLTASGIDTLKSITVTATVEEEKPPVPTVDMYGDVNGDKNLSAIDASMVLIMALDTSTEYPEKIVKTADVNDNGIIDIGDASLILQKVLNLNVTFPVENPDK